MQEVAEVRGTNGYRVISTFSGCGGACLGFEMDGYEILYASEFVEAARDTYAANHPGVIIDPRDIRNVTGEDILKQVGVSKGEIDVLEGSPPCASFSTAGSREKAWGKVKQYSDTSQRADDLFFEYTRLIEEIQPKVFTAENVSGLVKGKAIGYFKEIIREMRSHGYEVGAKVLDASYLGVPQARQRLIFVGVRKDLVEQYGVKPEFPKPLPYRYAIKEVLDIDGRVIHDTSGQFSEGDVTDKPINTITTANAHWHIREPELSVTEDPETGKDLRLKADATDDAFPEYVTHDPETGQDVRIDNYAIANEWDKLGPGEQSEKYFQLVKPHPDKPIGTITATAGGIGAAGSTHPTQKRKFTLQELRALSSFPADFTLTGNYAQRWERIGRSVPPLMSRAIAETIRTQILDKIK